MKTIIYALSLLSFLAFNSVKAQDIICSDFCVESIEIDSLIANQLNVNMFFNGTSSDFINYPYFSSVTNLQGDTLATGGMNFFGQFGNSSYAYPMTTSLTSIPVNFECNLTFLYDTMSCNLSFPCPISSVKEENQTDISIQVYPNPSKEIVHISSEASLFSDHDIVFFDVSGKKVLVRILTSSLDNISLDVSGCPAGIYFLDLGNGQNPVKVVIE